MSTSSLKSTETLHNRTALVTGASRGIGRAIALAFAREGARIAAVARNHSLLESLVSEIKQQGGEAIAISADVSNRDDVQRMVNEAVRTFGSLDVLVNNAAIIDPIRPTIDITPAEWNRLMAINVNGVLFGCQETLPVMRRQGYGRIQNLGSGLEYAGLPGVCAYAASKAAVTAITRTLANETKGENIKINVHYPGNIRTDMNPTGHGQPEDAVPTALWLATLPDDGPTGRIFVKMKEVHYQSDE